MSNSLQVNERMIENQGRGLRVYICALPSPGIPTQNRLARSHVYPSQFKRYSRKLKRYSLLKKLRLSNNVSMCCSIHLDILPKWSITRSCDWLGRNHVLIRQHGTPSKKFSPPKNGKKEMLTRGRCLGIAERGGRTRSLKIKSLTLYRLS